MSNHVSKIDMRGLAENLNRCPFGNMDSVRCSLYHDCDPAPKTQYVCECKTNKPAVQSRGIQNE